MEYRSLGRTGLQVSTLTMGSMLLHEIPDAADAARLLDGALDQGVNSIDTANVYGRGASEERLGQLLDRNGRRNRLVLATKFHARMDDDDPNAAGSSRRHVIDACHESLRRLRTVSSMNTRRISPCPMRLQACRSSVTTASTSMRPRTSRAGKPS